MFRLGYDLFLEGGVLSFQMADVLAVNSFNNFSAGPDLRDGNFHHVAVTVQRNSTSGGRFYIDGQLAGTFDPTVCPGDLSNAGSLLIGDHPTPGFQASYHGIIDELSLYRRALTSNEISAIYNAGSSGKCLTPVPPGITAQPQSLTVNAGDNASFAVTATGAIPLNYQWSLNGTNILGATASSLTISNVAQTDLGAYAVVVSNAYGSTNSSNATLAMYPFLVTPFGGVVINWGQNAMLSVAAWGTGPLSYQWYENGAAINGATNQTFNLPGIQFTNAGFYSVVVSSALGSITNIPAQVVVAPAGFAIGMYPGITITGTVGYAYSIQSTPSLASTNGWTTVANLTLQATQQLWFDSSINAFNPSNPQRFYRVVPQP